MVWMGNLLMSIDEQRVWASQLCVMRPFRFAFCTGWARRKNRGLYCSAGGAHAKIDCTNLGDLADVIQSMGSKTPTQAKLQAKLQDKLQAKVQVKNAFAYLTVLRVSRVPQSSWPHSGI